MKYLMSRRASTETVLPNRDDKLRPGTHVNVMLKIFPPK